MNTCDKCAFWEKAREFETGHGLGLGRCGKAIMFWDATQWSDDGERALKTEHKDQKHFVQDGSDYHADLITAPDFGCVAFKERDK